jgi:mono/diheme cytochrome c family protein
MRAKAYWMLPFVLLIGACAQDGNDPAAHGKQIYLAECNACHNSDPAKDGPVGPAIKGSSRELLEARILRASYPPGYTPKRPTSLMPPQPKVAAKIPDLAAYLR